MDSKTQGWSGYEQIMCQGCQLFQYNWNHVHNIKFINVWRLMNTKPKGLMSGCDLIVSVDNGLMKSNTMVSQMQTTSGHM